MKLAVPYLPPHIEFQWSSLWASPHGVEELRRVSVEGLGAANVVSRSHCPAAGGFVRAPRAVGFDIEVTSRIRREVILRVQHIDEELSEDRPLSHVWCVREAGWKCLQLSDLASPPRTIGEFRLHWEEGICRIHWAEAIVLAQAWEETTSDGTGLTLAIAWRPYPTDDGPFQIPVTHP